MQKKKESRPFSCKMAADVADRLESYCEKTQMKKTAVVELALKVYLDEKEGKTCES